MNYIPGWMLDLGCVGLVQVTRGYVCSHTPITTSEEWRVALRESQIIITANPTSCHQSSFTANFVIFCPRQDCVFSVAQSCEFCHSCLLLSNRNHHFVVTP